jgi:hypothetical protein
MKLEMAPSVRSFKPSLAFPTKLTVSRCWKFSRISVRRASVSLFIVSAEALPKLALEPWRSPIAPNDSVFSRGALDTIAKRSRLDTLVDVKDSFSNGTVTISGGWKIDRG